MIGEIRPGKQAATQAALTAPCASTPHERAASAAMRLIDMGISRISSRAPSWAPAQRPCGKSVRMQAYEPDAAQRTSPSSAGKDLSRRWLPEMPEHRLPWRAGIYELMTMNDEIRECIMKSGADFANHQAGRPSGLRLLREMAGSR
jgi:type II secretory ATPase GspE/PulE/Tfp pilus assembly ATPase PilB-like protein